MNVEIGAEAALFPEKEYISGIFVAVQRSSQGIGISQFENVEKRYILKWRPKRLLMKGGASNQGI